MTNHCKQTLPLQEAAASDYIEHAKKINETARYLLRLETQNASALEAKISIGLSLQAGELAGKAMLRSLGHSKESIRDQHRNHDLLTLLRQVETEFQARTEKELYDYHHFLLITPTINGTKYGNTIGDYLTKHFASGAAARPRNYFYPDYLTFIGPKPTQALLIIIDAIIDVAEKAMAIIESDI